MSSEGSGGRKFSQSVSHHGLGHKHLHKFIPGMDTKSLPHKLWRNLAPPGPGLYRLFFPGSDHGRHFFQKLLIYIWTLSRRPAHYFFLLCTISLLEYLTFFLVRFPLAGLPQGVLGCIPSPLLPSPPP